MDQFVDSEYLVRTCKLPRRSTHTQIGISKKKNQIILLISRQEHKEKR